MKTFIGLDGNPIQLREGGYAKMTWSYDARGDLIEEAYFGADGRPWHDDGCVVIRYEYDALGRQTKVVYLDAQNRELQMELVIRRLVPGGLGATAGLAVGDRLLTYDGERVTSLEQLADLTKGAFSFRPVTVRRGSGLVTVEVTPGTLGLFLGLARVEPEVSAEAGSSAPVPAPAERH
jgi:YD repeat-containing protein